MAGADLDAAYEPLGDGHFRALPLTVGPWDPNHQHAGPLSALICRAVEREAAPHGLGHIGRLTVNLLRPAPVGECRIGISALYVGRAAGHFSGRLISEDKDIALFTALAQRETDAPVPGELPPQAPRSPDDSPPYKMTFEGRKFGYADLVDIRAAAGVPFRGPSAAWMRLNHPLIRGEAPSHYQRVVVAADSGNGVSASLDINEYLFVNSDLTINLFRRPIGEWICLEARTYFGGNGCGLAESALYDERGLIGRATQSLAVRKR
jgi:Thioesterase-like superfamily